MSYENLSPEELYLIVAVLIAAGALLIGWRVGRGCWPWRQTSKGPEHDHQEFHTDFEDQLHDKNQTK